MGQTKTQSWIESASNVALGFWLAFATQLVVYPLYGMNATLVENLQITVIFTVVSLIRQYIVRRGFNKLHTRGK
jgi:hypothetical protein